MDKGRRKFLKIAGAGAGALLLSAKPVADAIADSESHDGHADKPSPAKGKGGVTWAMVVDMQKCLAHPECNDCQNVCHEVHNVPDLGSKKEEIKWIWKAPYENVLPDQQGGVTSGKLAGKPFITLCNHCDDPPCVRVCPTQATFKQDNGIVVMDMHRCIGCRFCMAGCPYGSRSFNWRDPRPYIKNINDEYPTRTRGVVEKCNFCAERVAIDKIPLCVKACKYDVLTFGNIQDKNSKVYRLLESVHSVRRKPTLGTGPEVHYIL